MTPWIVPSSMNGNRTYQLEAPTSFITSMSWRRAKMAVRMVLAISNSAASSTTMAMMSTNTLTFWLFCWSVRMTSTGSVTWRTPGRASNCVARASITSASLTAGFTR